MELGHDGHTGQAGQTVVVDVDEEGAAVTDHTLRGSSAPIGTVSTTSCRVLGMTASLLLFRSFDSYGTKINTFLSSFHLVAHQYSCVSCTFPETGSMFVARTSCVPEFNDGARRKTRFVTAAVDVEDVEDDVEAPLGLTNRPIAMMQSLTVVDVEVRLLPLPLPAVKDVDVLDPEPELELELELELDPELLSGFSRCSKNGSGATDDDVARKKTVDVVAS